MDFALTLSLLFLILLGFLIGLILISFNIIHLFQKALYLSSLALGVGVHVAQVSLANLGAHRVRNSRTSLMLSVALSFVMFMMCTIELLVENNFLYRLSKYGVEVLLKADGTITSPEVFEDMLRNNGDVVAEWSWIT
jgi:ABC-type transport system involved in multi-copper enzyme maturation permease subunit